MHLTIKIHVGEDRLADTIRELLAKGQRIETVRRVTAPGLEGRFYEIESTAVEPDQFA
jgi:hypothetical protein